MINIAIVEDDDSAALVLRDYLTYYQEKNDIQFDVKRFNDALSFLSDRRVLYDIIFMDIELPNLNGMDAALKLREFDKQSVLIFVTNMAQFAVKGYEADALDFMVKPISYQDFSLKIAKAINIVRSNADIELVIARMDGFLRLSARKIIYIEVTGHKLSYHTIDGEIVASGSLSKLEAKLKPNNFMRCNSCYLVNPKYIQSVQGYDLLMSNGDVLKISRPRKKQFMTDLANWLGQGNFI
jgi:DNA-binding LytR/AlgR family response regulator